MLKQVFNTTLIAGTLDIIAAFIQAYLTNGTKPGVVLKFIASGIFGSSAFAGDYGMITVGLLAHYLIAFCCTLAFFMAYRRLAFLRHSVLLNATLIAVIAWAVTTQIIIPASQIKTPAFDLQKTLIAIAILFFCIGLPIAYFAKRSQPARIPAS